MPDIIYVAALIAGFLSCFFGYRLLRVAVPLMSLLLGFSLSYLLFGKIFGMEGVKLMAFSIGTGALIAAISAIFIKVCVFLAGGIGGIIVFRSIDHFLPAIFGNTRGGAMLLTGLLFFAVFGFIALKLKRTVLIAATAYAGAYFIVTAISSFAGLPEALIGSHSEYSLYLIFALAAFTLAGYIAQRKLSAKFRILR